MEALYCSPPPLPGCYLLIVLRLTPFFFYQGKDGVAIVKTNQAIIVGHYGPQHQAGNAANVVEKLADYLIGLSY